MLQICTEYNPDLGNTISEDVISYNRKDAPVCPIMMKKGYMGEVIRCDCPKIRRMMPCGVKCYSSDTTKCLLREIPGVLDDKISLFSEINYLRYYRHEKKKDQKWYYDDMPKFLFREKITIHGISDLEISLFKYIKLIKLRMRSFFF